MFGGEETALFTGELVGGVLVSWWWNRPFSLGRFVDQGIFSREMFFHPSKNYLFILKELFENLRGGILKSITKYMVWNGTTNRLVEKGLFLGEVTGDRHIMLTMPMDAFYNQMQQASLTPIGKQNSCLNETAKFWFWILLAFDIMLIFDQTWRIKKNTFRWKRPTHVSLLIKNNETEYKLLTYATRVRLNN